MIDRVVIALVVIGITGGCTSAVNTQEQRDREWLAAMETTSPCTSTVPSGVVPKELTAHEGCVLTAAALREIAAGRAAGFGVAAGDTSAVRLVNTIAWHFVGLNGTPDQLTWNVHLEFSNGKPAAELVFDRTHHTVSVTQSEHDDYQPEMNLS